MVKIDLPEPDESSGRYVEYSFDDANHFYDVLLNFEGTINNGPWAYVPSDQGQLRWIFRGHWDSSWGLIPSVFRKEAYEKLIVPQNSHRKDKDKLRHQILIDQIMTECELLRTFMETANDSGIECNYTPSLYDCMKEIKKDYNKDAGEWTRKRGLPSWPFLDSSLEWPRNAFCPLMSLARHHGIPTRLLDFTYNHSFAAFFAASHPFFEEHIKKNKSSKKDGKLCIWAINQKTEISYNSPLEKIPAPSTRSSNLFSQEGILMLDRKANRYFMEKGEWRDLQTLIDSKRLIKITLPQSEYKKLLRLLWNNNITPARIMPNLDRATQTLEYTQWLWA